MHGHIGQAHINGENRSIYYGVELIITEVCNI